MKSSLATILPALLVFAAACSSGDDGAGPTTSTSAGSPTGPGSGGGASASASTGVTTGPGGAGGDGPTCNGPGMPTPEKNIQVKSVSAKVTDINDAPVADAEVQVCGFDECLYGTTNANGDVVVNVNKMLNNPAFKFGDGLVYAKFGMLVDDADTAVGTVATPKLPATGVEMLPGKDATSGDVTLSIPEGGVVIVDRLVYDEPSKQGLRATTIPSDKFSPAVDPALNLELLYGIAPVDTVFCPAAKVTVPNSVAWPAGADVEFWVHGVNVIEDWAPYAGWVKASDGKVSTDGKTISTVDGGGFSMLSSFGVRQK